MLELNKIHLTDCNEGCKKLDDESIDLVVTSPPYDNLRNYDNGQGSIWGESVWKAWPLLMVFVPSLRRKKHDYH